VSLIKDAELPTGPDWDQVFAAVDADPDTACEALGLVACTFVEDGIGPTIFTIGSTKDYLPIAGWFHTDGASPDKGEILNAYAAKAIDENDDQLLYFGMDRYAVDGSTDIGFWFFQDQIVACPDPDAPAGACEGVPDGEFAGEHVEGDVLILGTFTQGGATSDIRVFQWVDSGGNEQENIEGPTGAFGDCVPGEDDDEGCATVNNTTIEVDWNYTFKGESVGGWVPAGGFFEGGINLTAAGIQGCFSSFLAETRSSPEITAILKDFALGDFESCDTDVTTTPSDGDTEALSGPAPLDDTNDNDIPDIQLGTGDAGADVTDAAIVDVKGISEWDGTLTFYLCGPIPTSELCDGEDNVGVEISSHVIDETDSQPIFSDVANLTEVGYYCWRGFFDSATDGVPDATDASVGECFEVLPVTPVLDTESVNGLSQPFSGPVPFGDNVYDKAMLTGTADGPGDNGPGDSEGNFKSIDSTNGDPADGTITFTLYVDAGDTCGAAVTATSGSNPEVVNVSGDGDYYTSGVVTDSPGVFAWAAVYSGSVENDNTQGASHNTDCTDAAENYTVQQLQPSLSTAQSFIPNDSVTVTVEGGAGALDGTVTFRLWVGDENCGGTADQTFGPFDIDAADVGATLSDTAETSNSTAYSGSQSFYWKVDFTSSNPAHLSIEGVCGNENSSTTVDDGGVESTPPSS
jgi:hypothetical protein